MAQPPRAPSTSSSSIPPSGAASKKKVVVKVGMLGDAAIGKTSMMVKYVDGRFDEDYIETLGQKEFAGMLPLVCNEAAALLFMFDLSRKATLTSVKEWYKQARGYNKTAIPILVGTKYDKFAQLPREEQAELVEHSRRYAKAMKAPLVFCSSAQAINVQNIFKIILSKVFDLKLSLEPISGDGEPLLEFQI